VEANAVQGPCSRYHISMDQTWRTSLAEFIAREARPIEKYGHQPRLYALTKQIGEGLVYDDDVVYASAWLHDLGVFIGHRPEDPILLARWDCVLYALDRAPGLLMELGFPRQKIAHVLDCIRTHQPTAEPTTLEATILRDADMLEQLGAIGIFRTACKVGRDTRFHSFTDAASSLQNALQSLPPKLQLPRAQELAAPRIEQLSTFLASLHAEAGNHLG
jgi:uncharacterized protein